MAVETYKSALADLEADREKILRDRQALTFAGALAAALTLLAVLGLAMNPTIMFSIITLMLFGLAFFCFNAAASNDRTYQRKFSSLFTRNWIHDVFPEIYFTQDSLAPLALDEQVLGITKSVLKKTTKDFQGVEKLMFEGDPYHTTLFVLEKRSLFAFQKRSTFAWFVPMVRDRSDFLRVSSRFLSSPTVEERGSITEADRGRFLSAHAEAVRLVKGHSIILAKTETGLWLVVDNVKTPFRAPVASSCFNVGAYQRWMNDARLPMSNEMRNLLISLR
ncbi:MAG TPA: hypothetical protein VM432_11325 [Bdellovibrionales bacterium]|nr:hypothetical protein [Bdellovibrionales bacterium]